MVSFRIEDEIAQLGVMSYVRTFTGPALLAGVRLDVDAYTHAVHFESVTTDLPAAASESSLHKAAEQITNRLIETGSTTTPIAVLEGDAATSVLKRSDRSVAAFRAASDGRVELRWVANKPVDGAGPRELIRRLARRQSILEPFDRIEFVAGCAPEEVQPAQLSPPAERFLVNPAIVEWPHDFMDYQRQGIRALIGRSELLLADDMGLGKTVQTIAALRILFRTRRIEDALIVTPASVLRQWYVALRKWAPDLRVSPVHGSNRAWRWRASAHVYLTTFETLRSDFTPNPQSPPRRRNWGVLVLDEAQKIKNREVDLARVCKQMPRQRSWALTGTPLENRLDDLRSICEFLTPSEEHRKLANTNVLRETHSRLQLRRRKQDVLTELPPKQIIPVEIDLTPTQRRSYEKAEREGKVWLDHLGEDVTITHVLELITRLKQLCNFCPETGDSAKLEDLSDRLEQLEAQNHRALVFSQYVDDRFGVRRIADGLSAFHPLLYTGDMSGEERDVVLRNFRRSERPVPLLLSLRAGGQGLNLQEASYVFHFDRWWNPAAERQAEDRTHRMGQTQPVTVYTYTCRNTIEERIDEIIRSKTALFNEWVDEVTIDVRKALSQDELFGLFGMTPPRRKGSVS